MARKSLEDPAAQADAVEEAVPQTVTLSPVGPDGICVAISGVLDPALVDARGVWRGQTTLALSADADGPVTVAGFRTSDGRLGLLSCPVMLHPGGNIAVQPGSFVLGDA